MRYGPQRVNCLITGPKECSKCFKSFPTEYFGAKPDYSGYDFESWPKRESLIHIQKSVSALNAKTATEKQALERSYGRKYSVLYEVPALDIVHLHTVDPMHNLFLGLPKSTVKKWKEASLLSDQDYELIQDRVDSMVVPSKIGRIPRKIASKFVSVTADEWQHWTLIYCIYALHGVLPQNHYRCWCKFVTACRVLLQVKLTPMDVKIAHLHLVEFCVQFQEVYGAQSCTPNMHMACHLEDSILDYGVLR